MSGSGVRVWLVCVAALVMASLPSWGADGARERAEEAQSAFDAGAKKRANNVSAVEEFRKSEALYRRMAEEAMAGGGLPSAELMFNVGTAASLAGDHGEAVLWLKRAERVAPMNAEVRANLGAARDRAATGYKVAPDESLLGQLTVLEFVGAPVRFWGAAAGLAGMWVLAFWRLASGGWRPSGWAVGACALVGVVCAGSLVPRELRLRDRSEAVVLMETTGRAGPDAVAYEAKPSTALKAGTEVRVVEVRGGWTLVELGDGVRSWVEGEAVGRVGESASMDAAL